MNKTLIAIGISVFGVILLVFLFNSVSYKTAAQVDNNPIIEYPIYTHNVIITFYDGTTKEFSIENSEEYNIKNDILSTQSTLYYEVKQKKKTFYYEIKDKGTDSVKLRFTAKSRIKNIVFTKEKKNASKHRPLSRE